MRVRRAQARLPSRPHQRTLGFGMLWGWDIAIPELEMVVRENPLANACLGERVDIRWILAHDTPPL
ncbi:MAG TPA: hypothetical protein VFH26_00945 [Gemmatimonadales bacterium]|nr:hypothetical protein [Gemmatimonadales bacterium]